MSYPFDDYQGHLDEMLFESYEQGRKDAIGEAVTRIKAYASVWMQYTDGMKKEQIAEEALKAAKESMICILKEMM